MITVPLSLDLVRGALDLEDTGRGLLPHRLPARARRQVPDPAMLLAEAQPSGVRLAFRTAADAVELDVLPTKRVYPGAPPRPHGRFDLVVDGHLAAQRHLEGGDVVTIDLATGRVDHAPGVPGTLRFDLPPGAHDIELWLPHDEQTALVALRADAPVEPLDRTGRLTWLHHGSSISHGSNAAHPTGTWPALAAALAGVELVNLGFGGNALLDPFVARTVRDTPADVISLKIGINLVNVDLMRRRALGPAVHGFLDTIREGHPDAPLLVVSPILCPIHEDTPGPAAFDSESMATGTLRFRATGDAAEVASGRLTLRVVREELAAVVAARSDDPHLHLLDGRELYGEEDADALPLPDGLHPDAATHRLMGERFATLAFGSGGPFGRPESRPA